MKNDYSSRKNNRCWNSWDMEILRNNLGIGDDMQEEAKTVMDSLAVGGTVATLAGWLPSIASLFTIIWLSLRIWESDTVQKLVKRDD